MEDAELHAIVTAIVFDGDIDKAVKIAEEIINRTSGLDSEDPPEPTSATGFFP